MAIATPLVAVFQEFSIVPTGITDPLRAHISGPNAQLHRYSVAAEKALIDLGEYDPLLEACYPWPGRVAGSIVDLDYARVFIDNALLLYHEDLLSDSSGGRGTVSPVAGRTNWLKSSTLSYKANGAAYPRSSLFGDRDVAIGDRVYIRGVTDDDACDEIELWTYVKGFASEEDDAVVGAASVDTGNQATVAASTEIEKTGGPDNCISATADGSVYDGLADGDVTDVYTIEVVKSSITGCDAARLRVTTASGRDDADEVEVTLDEPTDIGTRGLAVTFTADDNASCSSNATEGEVLPTELVVGQKWQVTVTQEFEAVCATSGGTYAGDENDVYVIEVTKGGLWDDLPEISVTTVKGLDFSGPTEVTGELTDVPVGSQGVTVSFNDCFGSLASEASAAGDDMGGDSTVAGLRKGDKFYITVTAAANAEVRTLILQHDIPPELAVAADLDLRLYIRKDIELSVNRVSDPPLTNWSTEPTQLCLAAGATAYDTTWTDNGVEQPMAISGGTLYVQYREWLTALTDEVGSINDVADLADIPGQLDVDNPLKWGVFKALQNSNGTAVKYTAVADPTSLDSWQDVIDMVDGRDDLYNFVPLTRDVDVISLFQAHAGNESAPETGNWKAVFFNLLGKAEKLAVGKSAAAAQALTPTSTDGEVVLATLSDDPQATGTQYTRLRVPAANGGFVTHGVIPGDLVRYLFTVDAFGTPDYQEFVVDQVLSEDALLLLDGPDAPVNQAQKMEIWHRLSKPEVVDDLKDQAQAFADRRMVAIWPDLVGSGGVTQAGYFLCAALAGLRSGVAPQQGLTNVQVAGFDDYSRSKGYLSSSQLDDLDDGGVWIVTEDRDGTPFTRHALTTDTTDLNRQEEMVRVNVDSISFFMVNLLRPLIGRTNVTPLLLEKIRHDVSQALRFLESNGATTHLGSQLISSEIRTLRQHPLLADHVEIVLDLVVPYPVNRITLTLVV